MYIKNLKFEPLCPQSKTDAALEWLKAATTKATAYGNANFGVYFTKSAPSFVYGAVCHARLQTYRSKNKECVALYTNQTDSTRIEKIKGFFDWFVNESFAKDFILAYEFPYGVVVSADIPAKLMQNIAIVSRHFRELSASRFELFDYIVSKGISGSIAYPVAFNAVDCNYNIDQQKSYPFSDYGGGHRAWQLFNLKSFQNFLAGEFSDTIDADIKFRDSNEIHGGLKYCGNAGNIYSRETGGYVSPNFVLDLHKDEDFCEELRKYRAGNKGDTYRPPNPFSRTSTILPRNACTFKEVVEFVLPYCVEKEILVAK